MSNLIAAAAFFVLLHPGVSGSPLRHLFVRSLGDATYARLFQLASLGGVVWLGFAYGGTTGAADKLWVVHPVTMGLQLLLQPMALLLLVSGITTPNPGTFGQEAVADTREPVRGMLRVTRHPFLWGVTLFAIGHLLVVPTPRGLVLFGSLAFVALTGTFSIDAKRRRSLGPKWDSFEIRTSNIPFAAIAVGRQALCWREIGWRKPLGTIGLAALFAVFHPLLFGGSVLP
jgi:uncharacterized membrane protein